MNISIFVRIIVIGMTCTCSLLVSAASAEECKVKVTIKEVGAGWIAANQPPDSGNAVIVNFIERDGRKGAIMLNRKTNLNDPAGASLLSMLLIAKTTGQAVTLSDHHPDLCDDFDEVTLHGY